MSTSRQKRYAEHSPRTVIDDLKDFCNYGNPGTPTDPIIQKIMETVHARTGQHCTSIAPFGTDCINVTFSRANEAQFLHWSNEFQRWEQNEDLRDTHCRKCHYNLLTRFLMRLEATNLLSQLKDETGKVLYNYDVNFTEENVFWLIDFSTTLSSTRRYQNGSISTYHKNVYITVKERNDLIVSPRSRLTIISRSDERDHSLPSPTLIGFDSEGLGLEEG